MPILKKLDGSRAKKTDNVVFGFNVLCKNLRYLILHFVQVLAEVEMFRHKWAIQGLANAIPIENIGRIQTQLPFEVTRPFNGRPQFGIVHFLATMQCAAFLVLIDKRPNLVTKMVGVKVINPFVTIRNNTQRIQPKHRLFFLHSLGKFGLPIRHGYQLLKIACRLVKPVIALVGRNAVKRDAVQRCATQIGQFVHRRFCIVSPGITDVALTDSVFLRTKNAMATPVWIPKTLCLVPEILGLRRTSEPRSRMYMSENSWAANRRKPSSCRVSKYARFVMNAMMPSSDSRSEAQRMNRLYMSYCLVFCAVLSLI